MVVPISRLVHVHIDDFFGAGVEHFFTLDGEYPPIHVQAPFPQGVITDVGDVVAVWM